MESTNECPLLRLRAVKQISEPEYLAGVKWRDVALAYLRSIGAPSPYGGNPDDLSDGDCEDIAQIYKRGSKILIERGKRVFHAVNAIVVYEEPEELGDFKFTLNAARVGLSALAREF